MAYPDMFSYPCCSCNSNHGLKEDCYWYSEEHDMGARIPYCGCKSGRPIESKDCENCEKYHNRYHKTKGDSIRSMTDEELAECLYNVNPVFWSKETWLKWLQKKL